VGEFFPLAKVACPLACARRSGSGVSRPPSPPLRMQLRSLDNPIHRNLKAHDNFSKQNVASREIFFKAARRRALQPVRVGCKVVAGW